MSVDANDFLMGGVSAPSAAFPAVGAVVAGTLIAPAPFTQQQRDFDSQQPKFWEDGSPMLQLVVTLATSQRDPAIPDDDGTRRLYVKGNLRQALAEAVRKSGAKTLAVGGYLETAYTGDEAPKRRGLNGAKLYACAYTPPNDSAGFLAKGDGGQAQANPEQQPQYAPPPQQFQQPQPVLPQPFQPPVQQPVQQPVAQVPPVRYESQGQSVQQPVAQVPQPSPVQQLQQPVELSQPQGELNPEQLAALRAAGLISS